MIIAVYSGATRDAAHSRGDLHFQVTPQMGDHVELDGFDQIVRDIWHRPDEHFAGPKLAVLVTERVKSATGQDVGDIRAPACALV